MFDPARISPGERQRRSRPLLRKTLGEVLRRTRLEQGRTLADVARAAKVSAQYLSELERGLKEASSEVLAAICDALRVELSDLLAEVGRGLADDRAHIARRRLLPAAGGAEAGSPGKPFRRPGESPPSPPPAPGDVRCLLAA